MRELLTGLVTAQFLGYMMKTGACPPAGDINNMIAAAERAIPPILEAYERVEEIRRKQELKAEQARHAQHRARHAVSENCLTLHPAETRTVTPSRTRGGDHLSNPICPACAKTLEALP